MSMFRSWVGGAVFAAYAGIGCGAGSPSSKTTAPGVEDSGARDSGNVEETGTPVDAAASGGISVACSQPGGMSCSVTALVTDGSVPDPAGATTGLQMDCTILGGMVVAACPATGVLGTCDYPEGSNGPTGTTTETYYYMVVDSGSFDTATACSLNGGNWSAGP